MSTIWFNDGQKIVIKEDYLPIDKAVFALSSFDTVAGISLQGNFSFGAMPTAQYRRPSVYEHRFIAHHGLGLVTQLPDNCPDGFGIALAQAINAHVLTSDNPKFRAVEIVRSTAGNKSVSHAPINVRADWDTEDFRENETAAWAALQAASRAKMQQMRDHATATRGEFRDRYEGR